MSERTPEEIEQLVTERAAFREAWHKVCAERDALAAEVERMRPVVAAACDLAAEADGTGWHSTLDTTELCVVVRAYGEATDA